MRLSSRLDPGWLSLEPGAPGSHGRGQRDGFPGLDAGTRPGRMSPRPAEAGGWLMRIPPQSFFRFCEAHVPLLRRLASAGGEVSEADVRRMIRDTQDEGAEQPDTTWRRLVELHILVPSEPGSDFHFVAEPVRRLLDYLFDAAQAATPEIVRGYIQSLEASGRQLARSIEQEELTLLRLAIDDIQKTLLRVQADLDETHRCILNEVSRYKTERRTISVRDKFRRIVHWMERYVEPMSDVVRPDGPLRSVFDETGRLLVRARDRGLFTDLPTLERSLRLLRIVQRHALRVFQQCRRELQPLYDSLRRSSFLAEGAAKALEALQRDGPAGWAEVHGVKVFLQRWQHVPSDVAIARALRNVAETTVEPPPVLGLDAPEVLPPDYLRRLWLEGLPDEARGSLPIDDLLGWIVQRHPARTSAEALAGFTRLVFDRSFSTRFDGGEPRVHATSDGELESCPVHLSNP